MSVRLLGAVLEPDVSLSLRLKCLLGPVTRVKKKKKKFSSQDTWDPWYKG